VDRQREIRDFLTTRRAKITPEQAGIATFGGIRRVPGLRREEVAQLAGVSVDYYNTLERGKTTGASAEVLDAVATALQLTPVEREHLHGLFRPTRAPRVGVPKRQRPLMRPGLQSAIDSMTVPAVVNNHRQDLVATNPLARALYPHAVPSHGRPFNHARFAFLDPQAREFYVDHQLATRNMVALLRTAAGKNPFDDDLIHLIGQLSTQSEAFARLWASHDVIEYQHGTKRYRHPLVGNLSFGFESFQVPTDPDLTMLIYTVEVGSATEDALRILESWTSTSSQESPQESDTGASEPR
jgi:transcriptional regulator with XRE-family HTH domain